MVVLSAMTQPFSQPQYPSAPRRHSVMGTAQIDNQTNSQTENQTENQTQGLSAWIRQRAIAIGFHQVGLISLHEATANSSATAPPAAATAALQTWLQQGHQADMAWMADPRRAEVRQYWPPTRSIICVALNYYHPAPRTTAPNHAKIARYAWGRDYHRVLESRLKQLDRDIRAHLNQSHPTQADPNPAATYQARLAVDSRPVMDKALAQQAGLGWIGKHANLISRRYGSWLFLGALLTNLDLVGDRPHTAHCGTCTRCIEACPTQAIVAPFTVDANRCIAYHTIENRSPTLPPAIAPHLQGWVAGCDICQDVCPWNQRFAQPTDIDDFNPRPGRLDVTHQAIAAWRDPDWDQFTRGSALRRIKPAMFRRNAIANTPTHSS